MGELRADGDRRSPGRAATPAAPLDRILVVDDDAEYRDGLARALEDAGSVVLSAGTVGEAVAMAAAERPDAIVLDVQLPDGTGWDVLDRIGGWGGTVLVASSTPVIPPRRWLGVAHTTKPVSADTIRRRLAPLPQRGELPPAGSVATPAEPNRRRIESLDYLRERVWFQVAFPLVLLAVVSLPLLPFADQLAAEGVIGAIAGLTIIAVALNTGWLGAVIATLGAFVVVEFGFVDRGQRTLFPEVLRLVAYSSVALVSYLIARRSRKLNKEEAQRADQLASLLRLHRDHRREHERETVRSLGALLQDVVPDIRAASIWAPGQEMEGIEQNVLDAALESTEPVVVSPEGDHRMYRMFVPLRVGTTQAKRLLVLVLAKELSTPDRGFVWVFAHELARMLGREANRELELERERDVAASEAKSLLLSSLSHDLRGPLGAIRSFASLLRAGAVSEDRVLSIAEDIDFQAERAASLLAAATEWVRVESGVTLLTIQPVEVAEIVGTAVQEVEGQTGRTIKAGIEPSFLVANVDPLRMHEVFANLLSNACRYSDAASPVEIAACSDNADLVVQVRDRGVGMPPETARRIFDSFYRSGSAQRRRPEGLGLGLSIALALVQAHNGRIEVTSAPGEGSTFIVRIPDAVEFVGDGHSSANL